MPVINLKPIEKGWAGRSSSLSYPPTSTTQSSNQTRGAVSRSYTPGNYSIEVALTNFDTSVIPSNAVINSATLQINVRNIGSADDRSICADWYNSFPIDNSDYTTSYGTSAIPAKKIRSLVANGVNTFALNDFATKIRKGSTTGFRFYVDGGQPSGENYAQLDDYTLIIDYTANTPPTLTLTSPTDNQTLSEGQAIYTGNKDFTIKLTADDGDPDDTLEYQIQMNGVIKRDWTPIARNTPVDYTLLRADYINDRNPFTVTVRDSQGGQTAFNGYLDKVPGLPINVVSQPHLVSRMAPPVRLSNGWLVGAVVDSVSNRVRFYKSPDKGKVWEQLCEWSITAVTANGLSLESKGTRVYAVSTTTGGSSIAYLSFDAATQTNTALSSAGLVDSVQNALGASSLAKSPDGTKLWWAASTKNSTYPNSFNIRAGSIPINADGTLGTPSAVEQVTSNNLANQDNKNPTISFVNGKSVILFEIAYATGTRALWARVEGAAIKLAYNGYSYATTSPYAIGSQGVIHAVFHGRDASDTATDYVRYFKTSDGTTWTTPIKLIRGTNANLTSDGNGKLIIHYEESGYIKRIESTDEFATFTGPVIVEQGSNPASLYDPTFSTPFSVPPTIYQTSSAVRYYGILNQTPTVTLTTSDGQVLTEEAVLRVEGSALDFDVDNNVLVKYQINNGPIRNLQSGLSDGVTPILFGRNLTHRNKRVWDGSTDVVGADLTENTDHFLKVWAEDDQGGKSAEVTRKFRVIWNRPPVIDGQNEDLGTIMTPPSKRYTVTEPEGNPFTVSEKINGSVIRSFQGVAGREETVTIPHDKWIRLDLDKQHTLTVEAADSSGVKSTRTYTFVRTETHIEFLLNFENPAVATHFTPDGMPERVLVTLERYLPPGSSIESVKVCNNALDNEPTWEDATNAVRSGRGYLFTNTTKTAQDWRIDIWVVIAKGTATERVHINGYGGAYD